MQFGMIGSGSWATALAKILTDNGNTIHWWMRSADNITYMQKRRHNAPYLSGAYFNQQQLNLNNNLLRKKGSGILLNRCVNHFSLQCTCRILKPSCLFSSLWDIPNQTGPHSQSSSD